MIYQVLQQTLDLEDSRSRTESTIWPNYRWVSERFISNQNDTANVPVELVLILKDCFGIKTFTLEECIDFPADTA